MYLFLKRKGLKPIIDFKASKGKTKGQKILESYFACNARESLVKQETNSEGSLSSQK